MSMAVPENTSAEALASFVGGKCLVACRGKAWREIKAWTVAPPRNVNIIAKLWPKKSEQQKQRLAEDITKDVVEVLNYGEESVSVAMEEITPVDWKNKVHKPDIIGQPEKPCKKPGYTW